MHRLFVGLRPPPAMRAQLLALMGGVSGARWQSDEQLHLTLRFIGDLDGAQAEDAAASLASIDHPRPTIALSGVGSFDRKGRVHALWAGVAADPPLQILHDRVERALIRVGVTPEERRWMPHITIARLNRTSGPVEPFIAGAAGLTSAPVSLDAFILFESRLGADRASYDAVARYPLR